MNTLLAYTPFIDPINAFDGWFFLLLPLAILTALAYKAVRAPRQDVILKQAAMFALQIIGGIVGLYIFALITLKFVLPLVV